MDGALRQETKKETSKNTRDDSILSPHAYEGHKMEVKTRFKIIQEKVKGEELRDDNEEEPSDVESLAMLDLIHVVSNRPRNNH